LGSGTNQNDIEEILRVHNELRAKLANGQERRGRPGPQPSAADMEQMVSQHEKPLKLFTLRCDMFHGPSHHETSYCVLYSYNRHFEVLEA
jgi:hypothetical protein